MSSIRKFAQLLLLAMGLAVLGGCCSINREFEPTICYSLPPAALENLPTPFPPLTVQELSKEWGKELYLGKKFAREMDFYRALTCFKSALFLIPKKNIDRRLEIEYEIFLSYYLANKYEDAVNAFENSYLITVPESFPALHDLLIALYDAYIKIGNPERAYRILNLLGNSNMEVANSLILETAIEEADFPTMINAAECYSNSDSIYYFIDQYAQRSKSVGLAKFLNGILPGAGYMYVGQKRSAVTSFIINALFIAASYQLFDRGYIPAAIITTSLELGWYFGGINGAGLAAHEYNERLYECLGRETLMQNRLFPVMMLQASF